MHRGVNRIRDFRIVKCAICDYPLPEASMRQFRSLHGTHYQEMHPEFWKWNRKWRKPLFAFYVAIMAYAVWAGVYGFSKGNPLLVILLLLPRFARGLVMEQVSKLFGKRFRKDWQNRLPR